MKATLPILLTALCLTLSGCVSLKKAFSGRDYTLSPGDRLVARYTDGTQTNAVVASDGKVALPGTEPLSVEGLTPLDAQKLLQKRTPTLSALQVDVIPKERGPLCWRYSEPYTIAPLDRLAVRISDGREMTATVSQEGYAVFPQLGDFYVRGMPAAEASKLLAQKVPAFRELHIQEFRPNRVTVIGEVYHQIHTELTEGPMRVLDAIAAANGFTALAKKDHVKLIRQNAGEVEVYELDLAAAMRGRLLNHNLLLRPGDVITVPRSFL